MEIYILLIWFFVGIVTVLTLSLCYLTLAIRRAQKIESESLGFAQMIIEGQEKERDRIAKELHDVILPQVKDAALSASIRSICEKLIPINFDKFSLSDAILDLCRNFAQQSGIECICSLDKSLDFSALSAEHQLHLYRMIQESLNNVEKHSRSEKAIVTARYSDDAHIILCVSDDGVGLTSLDLSSAKKEHNGIGMINMHQRAAIIGAHLDFESESGHGLIVRIEISLNSGENSLRQE